MKDTTLKEEYLNIDVNANFSVYTAGKRVNTINHSYGPIVRDNYLFVLVNSGKALLKGKKAINFGENDLLVMFPGERVHYVAQTPWSIQWIGLYGKTIGEMVDKLNVSKSNPVLRITLPSKLSSVMEKIYQTGKEISESSRLMLTAYVYEFFSILNKNASIKDGQDYVYTATQIIENNLDCEISVELLSKKLHLNPSYFSRKFSERMGVSPKAYILEKKISKAKEFLLSTTFSVEEISNSVGFSDQLYFSRIFKQKTGLSPTAYREKIKL